MEVKDYFRLKKALNDVSKDIKSSLELTYEQSEIIFYLYEQGGKPVSLTDLRKYMGVSRSLVSKTVKELISLDYLQKYRDLTDERIIFVEMNDQQLEQAAIMLELMEEQLSQI
jgi:MarR family transcriptional regulator